LKKYNKSTPIKGVTFTS